MGSIHHANAKTTVRVRQEIQDSKKSIIALSKQYNLNPKTIMKWKNADRVTDGKSGPSIPKSTVLTVMEEQIICEFRRTTHFSLDDVYISLKDQIPKLTRSNLHRCLKRHNLNVLPKEETAKSKKKFKDYPIGYVHIDITQVCIADKQKLYLFVAIDRICKYAYVEIYSNMTMAIAKQFLSNVIKDVPFKIHTILTDNGAQFTYALLAKHLQPKNKQHPFDRTCQANGIKHKLTKFRHPWTNGQVEIFNKKIKAYTTKKYYYETVKQLKDHMMAFLLAYNYQKKLKALKYISPYDKLLQIFETNEQLFKVNLNHKIAGLNSYLP